MDTKWKNRKKIISFMAFFMGASLVLGNVAGLMRGWSGESLPKYLEHMLEDDYQQGRRFRGYISDKLEAFLAMAANSMGPGSYYGNYYNDYYNYYGGDYYNSNYYSDDYYDSYYDRYYDYYYDRYYDYYYDRYFDYYNEDYGYYDSDDFDRYYNYYNNNPNYYGDDYGDYYGAAESVPGGTATGYRQALEELRRLRESGASGGYFDEDYYAYLDKYYGSYPDDSCDPEYESSAKEQREEQNRKAAQRYHDSIREDKNLLYAILYDGKVLYANSEELAADGSMTAPEGYNFLLYYSDGKVRIAKDGQELDVYGDGYYRGNSQWYVPGYRNFQVDEKLNHATVCMAVAKEPVLYTMGTYQYGHGSVYRQTDNTLYWMRYNSKEDRDRLLRTRTGLAAGLALLLAFLGRKSKREAERGIARFTGKVWVELKAFFFLGILYLVFWNYITNELGYGYSLWQEMVYELAYEDNAAMVLNAYGTALLRSLPALFWITLFWAAYLIANDLRHNKNVWRHSLFLKLYGIFSSRELLLPLSRRMARRNTAVFCTAALYGLLMLSGAAILKGMHKAQTPWGAGLLLILTAGFLLAEYLICAKNIQTARDMQALSDRINDIRNGNYTEINHDAPGKNTADDSAGHSANHSSGHDLDNVMTQLEDIRHGMEIAVDEQMKSERMKVELIANVSHDIKTPLTSIISYVQFLKEEENLPEHVKDYVKILDDKSQRLNNMVQDVFAVSKAASGELPMNMEELDYGKLLHQTMADMEESIENSSVTFRTEIPDTPVMILADGQRMYRVFQNLFQNAIQYSLSGSRVYVTLKTDGAMAAASIKNTSQRELERGMDFTERFARGDQSRTDGESGLGLSIAQSFTEACGGQFELEMDADLFVVTVSFRTICQGHNERN